MLEQTIPSMKLEELKRYYESGGCPSDLVASVYEACKDLGPAFITMANLEEVRSVCSKIEAIPKEKRGPLWGAFYAVKDNVDIAGLPTTAACPAFKYQPDVTAVALRALEGAGCVCVGKTNMDQFAAGLNGTRSPYGTPKNALDAKVLPGGSSSGSATAVAAGALTFAIGTDTAGSGRVPAGLQGIIGVKPSVGLISSLGVVPACASLDCLSVFANSLDDGAVVTSALAMSATAVGDHTVSPELATCRLALEQWQKGEVGLFAFAAPSQDQLNFEGPRGPVYAAACHSAFKRALQLLGKSWPQATLESIDLQPFCKVALMLYGSALVAERAAGIDSFLADGDRDGSERTLDFSQDDRMLPVFRSIVSDAGQYTAADVFKAQAAVRQQRARCLAAMEAEGITILVVPTVMHHYLVDEFVAAEARGRPYSCNARLGTFTNFVNLMGMCGVSIPCGILPPLEEQGAPLKLAFGITILGRSGCDAQVWKLAHMAEEALATSTFT